MKHRRTFRYLLLSVFGSAALAIAFMVWAPGRVLTDGSHDLGRNGIWIQHGWLGDDGWFARNRKKDRMADFRSPEKIRKLAVLLREHGIKDVFPHLCPTSKSGDVPPVDASQAERFLETFEGFRVLPWVGGVSGVQAYPEDAAWRKNFAQSIRGLLIEHPKFGGIHINIEPCPSGDSGYLALLDEVRVALPEGKVLSVAAYPPPTLLHPFPSVHWERPYYEQVSRRADQVVVMMYDTAIGMEKVYRYIVSHWTREVLTWSGGTEVLIGLPAYRDEGVDYHDPKVENLGNALRGVHSGLSGYGKLPENYRGIALYCEWEMDEGKWATLRNLFLKR